MTRLAVRVAIRAIAGFQRSEGLLIAGSISYSMFLSLFPFLICMASVLSLILTPAMVEGIVAFLIDFAPEHIEAALMPAINDILSTEQQGLLTVSMLATIWSASNAVDRFRMAFDRAYGVAYQRSILRARTTAITFVILGAVGAMILAPVLIFGPIIGQMLELTMGRVAPFSFTLLRYVFGLAVFSALLMALHWALPAHRLGWRDLVPGVAVTTVLWALAATGLSFYVGRSTTYGVTYGALSGVAITLLFFYITGAIVIFGAEINAALRIEKERV